MKKQNKITNILAVVVAYFASVLAAYGEIDLELNQTVTGKIPIAVQSGQGAGELELVNIIARDFGYSEKVKVAVTAAERAQAEVLVKIAENRAARAEGKAIYCMTVGYPLQKTRKNQTGGFCLEVGSNQYRQAAHQFADKAHQHITGKGNIFTHRIGYVKESGKGKHKQYQVITSDFDRYREQVLLESAAPIMSLSFSPDGKKMAYVSFEEGVSRIYVQNLDTGERQVMAKFQGINSAPSWSPDGSKMVMALSFSGVTKLYTMDLKDRKLTKITSGRSIDTEPFWAADGKKIFFSSDRSGSPQIHEFDLALKKVSRVTHYGQYNVAPQVTSDGLFLVYLTRLDKKLQVVAQDLRTHSIRYLGNGKFDDTPRISPSDGLILYTTQGSGVLSMLSIVSIDGEIRIPMEERGVSLKYPSWSPVSLYR